MKTRPRAILVGTDPSPPGLALLAETLEDLAWTVEFGSDPMDALARIRVVAVDLVGIGPAEDHDVRRVLAPFEGGDPPSALLVLGAGEALRGELAHRAFFLPAEPERALIESAIELACERRRLLVERRNHQTLREKLDAVDGDRSLPLLVGRHLTDMLERVSACGGCVLASIPGRRGLQIVASLGLDEERLKRICRRAELAAGRGFEAGEIVALDDFDDEEGGSSHAVALRQDDAFLGILVLCRKGSTPFSSDQRATVLYGAGNLRLLLSNDRVLRQVSSSVRNLEGMQKQLIHAEKMAALGQLAAGIAHEINNPLTSILGFAELLLKRASDGDRTFLRKIVDNADRVKNILLDLKDFYVPAQHRKALVSLNAIVRNAVPIVRVHPDRRNVEIRSELHEGVGSIFADENQILQVLINLLTNAFHAMPDGGIVRISTWPEKDHVAVSVSDQGRGIPAEQLSRIFDPFYTTKSDWKGTGLGLAVCYTIVEDHGGDVAVRSTPGEGSCFTVRLPQVAAPEEITSEGASREAGGPSGPTSVSDRRSETRDLGPGRLRILVVDDEADCRSLLRELFEGFGHVVIEADQGGAAITRCEESDFDVAFLDYRMPGLSGLETFRRLRTLRPAMRIVVVTGSIGITAESTVRGDADGFVRKPFRTEEILARLNALRDRPTEDRCTCRP